MNRPRPHLLRVLTIGLGLVLALISGFATTTPTVSAQAPTPTRELTQGVEMWTLYPILVGGGYIDVSQIDRTTVPPKSVIIHFSPDGKQLELTNFRYFRYDETYTDPLDNVNPLILRQIAPDLYFFKAEGRSLEQFDPGGPWWNLLIRVVSADRLELISSITYFEGGFYAKDVLIRNDPVALIQDPRLTELPYPRCPGSPAPRLLPNQLATVTLVDWEGGGVNMRDKPSKGGQRLAVLQPNEKVLITGTPTCADGLTYYPAKYQNNTGFVAEGDLDTYWLEQENPPQLFALNVPHSLGVGGIAPEGANIPILVLINGQQPYYEDPAAPTATPPANAMTCPGSLPSRLVVGQVGRVSPGDANNMRDNPSRSAKKVGSIPAGAEFIVLDGPVCADGYAWWQVNYNGLIGWTVEGDGAVYWLEPL
ncbi:MAG: SH3 domain-containing protein [Anaerolineae bacterium]|nr:SH3 domain-containing protein [Anaerolineae bacterium]